MEAVVEQSLHNIGIYKIAGCDESGRGPLIQPLIVACVMLPTDHKIEGINDSKKLSAKKRESLAELIYERAIDIQVAIIMNGVVDRINIFNAVKQGMSQTITALKVKPEMVVVDGLTPLEGLYSISFPYFFMPKADGLSENVAAASIIAKVCRDHWVLENAHARYPEYGFDKHKGYGTKAHVEALYKYGPCPLHRKTFTIGGVRIGDIKNGK
jgi:ribonuclease HII